MRPGTAAVGWPTGVSWSAMNWGSVPRMAWQSLVWWSGLTLAALAGIAWAIARYRRAAPSMRQIVYAGAIFVCYAG